MIIAADGLQELTDIFNLCSPLKDVESLMAEIEDAWGSVAMVNYPYPTEFLQPLPGWPVKVSLAQFELIKSS